MSTKEKENHLIKILLLNWFSYIHVENFFSLLKRKKKKNETKGKEKKKEMNDNSVQFLSTLFLINYKPFLDAREKKNKGKR